MTHFEAAMLGAALGAIASFGVPSLIRHVPEPQPEPGPPGSEPEPPKELYTAIADRPRLIWLAPLAGAVAGAVVGAAVGLEWPLLFLLPLVPIGVALAVIDWRTRLLPTTVIAPTYVVTVALVLACWALTNDTDDLVRAGWGWLIAGVTFFALWFVYPRGLGYGDVRLSGILGIALGYLGWSELAVGLYAGFLLGGVGGGVLSLLRIIERRDFPFGPFMMVGALLGIAVGEPVLRGLAG